MEWIPYLLAASPAGLINVLAAWSELDKKCSFLPFFKPLKSFGFWIWLFMQFLTPSCVAWFLFSFFDKPKIDGELIFNVSVLGLVFVSVLNATTEVGSLSINIKPIYDYFIDEAFKKVADEQTIKTARFWSELELKLNQINQNTLKFLKNYFLHDVSLNELEKENYKNQINRIEF